MQKILFKSISIPLTYKKILIKKIFFKIYFNIIYVEKNISKEYIIPNIFQYDLGRRKY